ncbi:hypothetical protein ACYSNU_12405 [Enterococcus sp. LJL120]
MALGSRLVFFLCILLTCYTAEKYQQTTVPAKGPSPIARAFYSAFLNYLAFVVAGISFIWMYQNIRIPGTEEVIPRVLAGILALIFSGITLFAPKNKKLLTSSLKKMMLSVVFLLSLAVFPANAAGSFNEFLLQVVVYGGMYFIFSIAYSGALDRMAMADIPAFIKGLPLAITTLFLFYLSFSFFNGVFFGYLF